MYAKGTLAYRRGRTVGDDAEFSPSKETELPPNLLQRARDQRM
jgi:hypothetical protein